MSVQVTHHNDYFMHVGISYGYREIKYLLLWVRDIRDCVKHISTWFKQRHEEHCSTNMFINLVILRPLPSSSLALLSSSSSSSSLFGGSVVTVVVMVAANNLPVLKEKNGPTFKHLWSS